MFKQRKPRQFQYKSRFDKDSESRKENFHEQWETFRKGTKKTWREADSFTCTLRFTHYGIDFAVLIKQLRILSLWHQ